MKKERVIVILRVDYFIEEIINDVSMSIISLNSSNDLENEDIRKQKE